MCGGGVPYNKPPASNRKGGTPVNAISETRKRATR